MGLLEHLTKITKDEIVRTWGSSVSEAYRGTFGMYKVTLLFNQRLNFWSAYCKGLRCQGIAGFSEEVQEATKEQTVRLFVETLKKTFQEKRKNFEDELKAIEDFETILETRRPATSCFERIANEP